MAVQDINCIGFELRSTPSKHFAYIFTVDWTDKQTIIYRRYSQFFNLQCKLLDNFPEEAGSSNPQDRTIPFLPGKKLVGNFTNKTAEKRKVKLQKYLKELVNLPKIARSDLFLNFCQTKESDVVSLTKRDSLRRATVKCEEITAPIVLPQYTVKADYTSSQAGELNLSAGSTVVVMEKKHTGWWLAQSTDDDTQGWIPATYLDVPSSEIADESDVPRFAEKFICTEDYDAKEGDELSVYKGALVEVIKRSLDGWWLCRFKSREGFLPSAHLCRANSMKGRSIAINKMVASNKSREKTLSHYAPPRITKPAQKPPRPPRPPVRRNQRYRAVADFVSNMEDGVDLKQNDVMQVMTKDSSGWWYVDLGGSKGWAPASYIEPMVS